MNDLAKFYLISVFSEGQLEELAKITEKKTHKKHTHVYERGDRAKRLFEVYKGLVSLRRIDPGDEVGITFETRGGGENTYCHSGENS